MVSCLFKLHKSPSDEEFPFKLKRKEWILTHCKGLGIELGGGHSRVSGEILNVDIIQKGGITNKTKGFISEADLQWDARKLPFADECFDFVISSHLIEHIEAKKALEEWFRVLKKGGKLIIVTPDKRNWVHSPDHLKEFSPQEFEELVKKFGKIQELEVAPWQKQEFFCVVKKV